MLQESTERRRERLARKVRFPHLPRCATVRCAQGMENVRRTLCDTDRRIRRDLHPLRFWVREAVTMTLDYVLGGFVTVGLLVYLVYALLRPDRF